MKDKSATVSKRTKQAEETPTEWEWVESSVWTDSMLGALERGVKGGKWFSLIDKVYRVKTLRAAWRKVKANDGAPGIDQVSIDDYERHIESNLKRLSDKLKEGTYEPRAVRRTWIPKPGRAEKRPLGIPTVEDRIVQMALKVVLEPIFEEGFAPRSYGFRPRRGTKDALCQVDRLLKEGYRWAVDADLKGYFDTIDHEILMAEVEKKVTDGRVLELIRSFLTCEVADGDESYVPERGTPQGGVISPLLANIFLDPLDHMMEEQGFEMVRYADDFVVLCRTEEEANDALERVRRWTEEVGLTLHPEKTKLVDESTGSFDFLGYRFKRGMKFPSRKAKGKILSKIKEKTPRNSGYSLTTIIDDLNRTIRGWYEYFKHSHHNVFDDIDGRIRRRLRAILRKRNNLNGPTNTLDHRRWPNAYFANAGLFSTAEARRIELESLRKDNH
jgi:RNA-directed DNA polymerase